VAEKIRYYSTNLRSPEVSFSEALLKGLAPDGGLYMPTRIPEIPKDEVFSFRNMDYADIAFNVSSKFLGDDLPSADLQRIVRDAYDFTVPLEHVYDNKYVMRLDGGPTASFKDFAARMMGRLINYYIQKDNRRLLILTATSGDTGSAIANAFFGLDNIKVVVLFPKGEVTARQRKQMTTLGKNIQVLSLTGKFDDCQALVKQAFKDKDLDYLNLSSANSINIGRLIPQINYYFYSFARLARNREEEVIFSVPSGNFGDMMGCMLGKSMGLPVKKVIVATNANDEFPGMMEKHSYRKIDPSINCISSAMNVGHPSNLARLIAMYGGVMDETGALHVKPDFKRMSSDIYSCSVSDELTRKTIKSAWEKHRLLLEPHGAVGWSALEQFAEKYPGLNNPGQLFVCLETAHPAKFPEEIKRILGIDPEVPESLKGLEEKPEFVIELRKDYREFKTFLQDNYQAT